MSQAGSNSGGGSGPIPPFGPVNITYVDGPTTYVVVPTDQFIIVNTTAGAVTIDLPDPITTNGRLLVIKDGYGTVSDPAKNITVNPGTIGIENGGINVIMNQDYESINILSAQAIPQYWIW